MDKEQFLNYLDNTIDSIKRNEDKLNKNKLESIKNDISLSYNNLNNYTKRDTKVFYDGAIITINSKIN